MATFFNLYHMNTFIITAGGIGTRMGTELPKQFLLVHNKPILIHTLERFYEFDPTAQLIITLPEQWISYWEDLLKLNYCKIPHQVIVGGGERYFSIKNAIDVATGDLIGVHDGVRPSVSILTIQNCINSAIDNGSGIPFLELKESIRNVVDGKSSAAVRNDFVLVQTPQIFKSEILRKAYQQSFNNKITDDASLVEQAGYSISLVPGNEENIKVTTPQDLQIVELFLK